MRGTCSLNPYYLGRVQSTIHQRILLELLGHSGEVSASVNDFPAHLKGESLRNLPPDRKTCRKLLLRLVRKLGRQSTCALLSVESSLIAGWITGEVWMKPRERRLVWMVHALVFEPEKFRSLFDVITCGRFMD